MISESNNGMHHSDRRQWHRDPLRAVIFDWAGTVIDYGSRAPVLAVMRVFSSHGVPVTVDEARGPMGMAKRDHLRAVLELPRVRDFWSNVHGSPPDEAAIDSLYATFLQTQAGLLAEHADLIPGVLEAVEECRRGGMKIGSSTGYTRELMDILESVVYPRGFKPDAMVCASDVQPGRPAPWMCLENARRLNVYPMDAIVVVDDTAVGIEAGRNAGMWTVGVAKSGNLVGLTEQEFAELDRTDQQALLRRAHKQLRASGAHVVIDTVAELPAALDILQRRLGQGARPKAAGGISPLAEPQAAR